jgi:chromate transport protein ChrA
MDKLKGLSVSLALFAVLLVALPLMDWVGAVWPVEPGDAAWRFGAVVLLSDTLMHPLLGLVILTLVGALGEKKWPREMTAALSGLAATLLLVALPVFLLDALELRGDVLGGARQAFDMNALRTVFVIAFAVVVLSALGWAGYRGSRPVGIGKEHWTKKRSPLVSFPAQ